MPCLLMNEIKLQLPIHPDSGSESLTAEPGMVSHGGWVNQIHVRAPAGPEKDQSWRGFSGAQVARCTGGIDSPGARCNREASFH